MMKTFRVRLKKVRKPNQPRLRFDLEKVRDPDVACTFQATGGGKFAPVSDGDMDIDTMITTYEGISKSFEPNMERARNLDLFCFIFQRSSLPTPHTCPI